MEIATDETETSLIVHLKQTLSFHDHPSFNEYIAGLQDTKKPITFDLTELTMIDSAGIGMLFLAQKLIEKNGGSMSLRNPNGQVKRVFEITSIDQQIHIT